MFTQTLKFLRSTKSTHVYENLPEDQATAAITQVHIRMVAVKGQPPATITLTAKEAK